MGLLAVMGCRQQPSMQERPTFTYITSCELLAPELCAIRRYHLRAAKGNVGVSVSHISAPRAGRRTLRSVRPVHPRSSRNRTKECHPCAANAKAQPPRPAGSTEGRESRNAGRGRLQRVVRRSRDHDQGPFLRRGRSCAGRKPEFVLPIEFLEVPNFEGACVQVHDRNPERAAGAGDAHRLHDLKHVGRVADAPFEQRLGFARSAGRSWPGTPRPPES